MRGPTVSGRLEELAYWLRRYQAALDNSMKVQKKGVALFEKAKRLETGGAQVAEIEAILEQIAKILVNFREELTTPMNAIISIGDALTIEKVRSGYEAQIAKIDAFLDELSEYRGTLKK